MSKNKKGSGHDKHLTQPSRRRFLTGMAGGLAVGLVLPIGGGRMSAMSTAEAAVLDDTATGQAINAWIKIPAGPLAPGQGVVDFLFGGCEMGQGTMTGLAQLIAEELKVGWEQITVKRPDTSEIPTSTPPFSYVSPATGKTATASFWYGTGGSGGIKGRWYPLRVAAAQTRELLVAAAISQNLDPTTGLVADTDRSHYDAANGLVTWLPTGRVWAYGELSLLASSMAPTFDFTKVDLKLTGPGAFNVIGKPLPRPDIPLKVNGSAKYGLDIILPGMVFAAIKHCPTIGGVLAATPKVPSGALAVVPCKALADRGIIKKDSIYAVAVVADNTWSAIKLAKSLSASWTLPASTAPLNSASILQQAKTLMATPKSTWLAEASVNGVLTTTVASNDPNTVAAAEALALDAINKSAKVVEATFTAPFLAHATMEVLNCTVNITFSATTPVACEIWAPTQNAPTAQATALNLLKLTNPALTADKVVVHTTFVGGGLGRKIEMDYIYQAVQVGLAMQKPVKLTWSREEDFGHDVYRPMALMNVKAGLDTAKNTIAGSFYRVVTPSISWQRSGVKTSFDGQTTEGAVQTGYNLGTACTEWVPMDVDTCALPVGFWRSVGASMNSFASESMVDMLAAAAGMDPLAFRLNNVTDPRALAILNTVKNNVAWWGKLGSGNSWGMALTKAFGSYVCEVFEIAVTLSTTVPAPAVNPLTVKRVLCVVDCGVVVNPDQVEAQMQGGIIHGLNAALGGGITFVNGVAQQTNFNKQNFLRMNATPEITVQIMQNSYDPTGTGEPAVPPVAPALANAYARHVNGSRITSLPFYPT